MLIFSDTDETIKPKRVVENYSSFKKKMVGIVDGPETMTMKVADLVKDRRSRKFVIEMTANDDDSEPVIITQIQDK